MPKLSTYLHALNVGEVDAEAIARVDLERVRLAASIQNNLLPKTVGSAFMRPGEEYIKTVDQFEVLWPFEISADSGAVLAFSEEELRVRVNGVEVARGSVTAPVTNADMTAEDGWALTNTGGAEAKYENNYLELWGRARGGRSIAVQEVATSNMGAEHGLRIVVLRGVLTLRVGSTSGADDYVRETQLNVGTHSIAFTPGAAFHIWMMNDQQSPVWVDRCEVEGAGAMVLPTPYQQADLYKIRSTQSADVLFVACRGYRQYRVERRSDRSWSYTQFIANDGPFELTRSSRVKVKTDALSGIATIEADGGLFTSAHEGALIRIFNEQQLVSTELGAAGEYSDVIRVTGITNDGGQNDRAWTYTISGTWSGTLNLKRSFDGEEGAYRKWKGDITTNVVDASGADTDENAIVHYKIGFEPGNYTSGKAVIDMIYEGGGGYGIARIIGVTSATEASAEVLTPFKNREYSADWRLGEWSNAGTWPAAATLFDGRLFWGSRDKLQGSVSDAFTSYDEDFEGDGGPILRNLATGGVNDVRWMLSLQRLLIGSDRAEISVRSSSFDEPLTPTNITMKECSTYGSGDVGAVRVDTNGLFIDRSGKRLVELSYSGEALDYAADDLTKINRDILAPGVVQMAAQRLPDTRVWMVKSDGGLVALTYDKAERVIAFTPCDLGGAGKVESVCVIPGAVQDRVYLIVRRTIGGTTRRFFGRLALDADMRSGDLNCAMDAHVVYEGSPTANITGLTHLNGQQVVAWGDGQPLEGPFTVFGGAITLPSAVSKCCVGLAYQARFKSAKLAYASGLGTAIGQPKKVGQIGLVMVDTHTRAVKYGHDFDNLLDLPLVIDGMDASQTVWDEFDKPTVAFGGTWDADSRVHLQVSSPYSATISGIPITVETNDRS